jgi:Uma2 family endonuclease
MPLALKKEDYYTYADFLEWDEDFRAEIIDGELYMMAPPSIAHQDISGEIFGQIREFLKGKPCKVYAAPVGVRLFPEDDLSDDVIVEPDIIVVCDRSKLDKQSYNGAPDLVIEILSPSTALHDKKVKFELYKEAGVLEYWIVDPELKLVHAHILHDGEYTVTVYGGGEEAPVSVLPGCVIKLRDVFAEAEGS